MNFHYTGYDSTSQIANLPQGNPQRPPEMYIPSTPFQSQSYTHQDESRYDWSPTQAYRAVPGPMGAVLVPKTQAVQASADNIGNTQQKTDWKRKSSLDMRLAEVHLIDFLGYNGGKNYNRVKGIGKGSADKLFGEAAEHLKLNGCGVYTKDSIAGKIKRFEKHFREAIDAMTATGAGDDADIGIGLKKIVEGKCRYFFLLRPILGDRGSNQLAGLHSTTDGNERLLTTMQKRNQRLFDETHIEDSVGDEGDDGGFTEVYMSPDWNLEDLEGSPEAQEKDNDVLKDVTEVFAAEQSQQSQTLQTSAVKVSKKPLSALNMSTKRKGPAGKETDQAEALERDAQKRKDIADKRARTAKSKGYGGDAVIEALEGLEAGKNERHQAMLVVEREQNNLERERLELEKDSKAKELKISKHQAKVAAWKTSVETYRDLGMEKAEILELVGPCPQLD